VKLIFFFRGNRFSRSSLFALLFNLHFKKYSNYIFKFLKSKISTTNIKLKFLKNNRSLYITLSWISYNNHSSYIPFLNFPFLSSNFRTLIIFWIFFPFFFFYLRFYFKSFIYCFLFLVNFFFFFSCSTKAFYLFLIYQNNYNAMYWT
jgi:hypothetical protein